jgi:elongation factor Ts
MISDIAFSIFNQTPTEIQKIEKGLTNQNYKITIADKVSEQVGIIGEKIELAEYKSIEAPMVVSYVHMGNKAAVLIGMNKKEDKYIEAGKNIAMQTAAMKPVALDKDDVDKSIIEKEIEIGMEQARNEGKPENMLEKIATGKLQKFYKENTLLNQTYVKDNQMDIRTYIKSIDKDLAVTGFKHVMLG